MDRTLVLKLLGKKDSVDLGDQLYNLREITEELRELIILNLPIKEEIIEITIKRLSDIYNIIMPIKENFKDDNSIVGYTNSKVYLSQFINDLCVNIQGLIRSCKPFDNKGFIYHTNIIIDLVLVY
ncbi:hypothetical protein [Clostridium gasigenes]|uniref:Uncharacterized protein n=1 Tax=Clostridium gasigenes TaxID=94869 RepID=A0A1H0Q640_9CLOT|nr:hypothetical protein [Clostridium gasigenes]MBB6623279.1 hypothetical protein [Clostridium gasigenes]MBU3088092.1 hypothetical protein [Clostridium gasigenes]SDP12158.1 hypothetical protein SAMN04488529_102200 [Clostridium gasigenes]